MKKRIYILIVLITVVSITSCERKLTSKDVTVGEIAYPSIVLLGSDPIVQVAGGAYNDPGAQAFLGTEDITPQLEIDNPVDVNTPDVYTINYAVSTTNALGDQSSASASRVVMITSEDVSGIDLSGSYVRNGDPSTYPVVTATRLNPGIYLFPNLFGSGTVVNGFKFYHIGGDDVVVPIQNSQFGRLFGSGTLTADGFQYSLQFLDPPNTGLVLSRTFVKQ